MEPILVELKPGCTLTQDMPHEGQEFGYVLEGKVNIVYGSRSEEYSTLCKDFYLWDKALFILLFR